MREISITESRNSATVIAEVPEEVVFGVIVSWPFALWGLSVWSVVVFVPIVFFANSILSALLFHFIRE